MFVIMTSVGRYEALNELDPASMDPLGLEEALAAAVRLSADVERLVTRFSAGAASAGVPIEGVVRRHGERSNRESRQVAKRGETVAAQPALADQPAPVVDAAARAAASLPTSSERSAFLNLVPEVAKTCPNSETAQRRFARLADQVRTETASERLEAQRAAVRASRGVRPESGMYWLGAEFDPETGARIFAAWDAVVARLAAETDGSHGAHTMGLALADMLLNASGGQPGSELNLLIDAATLAGHQHDGSVSETYDGHALPPTVVERLSCIANMAVTVIDESGSVLNHGRIRRAPTKPQRDVLRSTYSGCGWPGCDAVWSSCEVHHVEYWSLGGRTDLVNLIPLCRRHHHDIHDRKWRLELGSDRSVTIYDPYGRAEHHDPPEPVHSPPRRSDRTNPVATSPPDSAYPGRAQLARLPA